MDIRNRIVEHITVPASTLVPHPANFRRHPAAQRAALEGSLGTIGLARSVLAYRLADGRLQLIDGHLRTDTLGDHPVTVEVLDVTPDEADALLLTLDPMAALADLDRKAHAALARRTRIEDDALADVLRLTREDDDRRRAAAAANDDDTTTAADDDGDATCEESFAVVITCDDEDEQRALLRRFKKEGLRCRAVMT